MHKRQLGKTGIEVAPLCFGGNVFGWTIDEKTSFAILDSFHESGFNFIDTADVYSRWVPGNKGGESEVIIGKWMKERKIRSEVVIATKVGMEMSPDKKGLKAAYIKEAVEDSLARLQTDYIDLYQSHTDDIETPIEETLAAYDSLLKEGKVRAIGASNFNGNGFRKACISARKRVIPPM
ncbi:aldo/keto reductase [Bdellovibrio sp. GT3]|uniref:aldo/keto reductase n=1 Tax=Bdellovibrio sp. GT3 TaxID=3136282 RepID=UPI0030F11E18